MRTGLVVIGAAIAVIGGGLFLTLFLISGGPAQTTRLTFDNPDIPGFHSWPEVITLSSTSRASISIVWTTNLPANVSLTPAGTCNNSLGVCPIGPPLFSWTEMTSGKASGSSGNASAFILEVTNPATAALQFTGTVSVGYPAGTALPTWAWGLIALGGVVLLAMGGIALFLGLFLPGGVYRDPPDPTRQMRPPPDRPNDGPPPG